MSQNFAGTSVVWEV